MNPTVTYGVRSAATTVSKRGTVYSFHSLMGEEWKYPRSPTKSAAGLAKGVKAAKAEMESCGKRDWRPWPTIARGEFVRLRSARASHILLILLHGRKQNSIFRFRNPD